MGTWSIIRSCECCRPDNPLPNLCLKGEQKLLYAHPAVKSLILDYFFAKANSLASVHLDAFGPLIPLPTLALVISAVSCLAVTHIHTMLMSFFNSSSVQSRNGRMELVITSNSVQRHMVKCTNWHSKTCSLHVRTQKLRVTWQTCAVHYLQLEGKCTELQLHI